MPVQAASCLGIVTKSMRPERASCIGPSAFGFQALVGPMWAKPLHCRFDSESMHDNMMRRHMIVFCTLLASMICRAERLRQSLKK